jgi:hypothetical protein
VQRLCSARHHCDWAQTQPKKHTPKLGT